MGKDVNIEKNIGHFFKQTILYNILAMNGLVSGYGSDSDDEEVTSDIKKSKDEDWMECMDNTTGYPYFWNRKTNEVRWDRPDGIPAQATKVPEKKEDNKPKKKTRSKSPPQVFIGPTLPQLTPEEIARQKVIKFEETMAKDIEKDVLKEAPPDWKQVKPQKGLYSKPFAWKKTNTSLQTYKQLESTLKKASQSISLIAGVYGDDNEEIKQEIKSELLVEEVDGVYDELNDDDTIQNAGDVSHIYFDYEDKDKSLIKEESIKKEIKTEESLHKDHKDGISMSKIKEEKIEMPNLESD